MWLGNDGREDDALGGPIVSSLGPPNTLIGQCVSFALPSTAGTNQPHQAESFCLLSIIHTFIYVAVLSGKIE